MANKTARIAWAVMAKGENFRVPGPPVAEAAQSRNPAIERSKRLTDLCKGDPDNVMPTGRTGDWDASPRDMQ